MAESTAAETSRQLAARCELEGDLTGALHAYETALGQTPGDLESLSALARIAGRLDMPAQSLALWDDVLAKAPANLAAVDGRARALAALCRFPEALETLRAAILDHPHEARLWNSLGLLQAEQSDSTAAVLFFDEALRLDPSFAAALYNRGDVRFDLGELSEAEADFAAAARGAPSAEQDATIAFAQALMALHRGDLQTGWDRYAIRLSRHHPAAPVFKVPASAWAPSTPLDGKHLLVVGEQGVGDEIMFASLLSDALTAVGPAGLLSVAVDPRLIALMQRSFPAATIIPHLTERRGGRPHRSVAAPSAATPVDAWAPMADLPRRFRPDLESFVPQAYLKADPNRVATWREWLNRGRPCVGLSWRSGLLSGRRRRQYPELQAWAPVLRTPGVTLVNMQYSATSEELAGLEALAGAPILTPPEIDLKADLDELAALCSAMTLVISVPNATAAMAGACGAPVWFVGGPAAWTRLGTDGYPWYANARSFSAARLGDWAPVLGSVAEALATLVQDAERGDR